MGRPDNDPARVEDVLADFAELVEHAQREIDKSYAHHADERQRGMGISYITAERKELARFVARLIMEERRKHVA